MKIKNEFKLFYSWFLIILLIINIASILFKSNLKYIVEFNILLIFLFLMISSFNFFKLYRKDPFYKELKIRKMKFFNLIDKLSEPVLIVNSKNRITVVNRVFEKTFSEDKIRKKNFNEVIKHEDLKVFIERIFEEKKNIKTDIEIHDYFYSCSGIYINDTDEVLLIFHDITERTNLENMKRDFIHNLSHELRTPLTSILGFTITLEEETEDETSIKYLEIIKRNTSRLINIVKDLLLISDMEYKKNLELTDVNLYRFIYQIVEMMQMKAKEKNLEIKINIPENIVIKADVYKLEQIFVNLLENAVKYTEKGFVSVESELYENRIIIKVIDSGIGIPEDKIDRIFERFFVVSKSRSRKKGGTGLGLSIVKHAVILHDGKIWCESDYGKGTTFSIQLPL